MADHSTRSNLLGTVVSLYMMTVMGMGVFYNWQYAREHGFVQWFLLGEIVPSAKALVWPYFAFGQDHSAGPPLTAQLAPHQFTSAEQQDHDREAISKFNSVTRKLTELGKLNLEYRGAGPGQIPQEVLDQMKAYEDAMLKEGREIDIEVLNSAYPELGSHFRDQFLRALSLTVEFENIGIEARKSGEQPPPLTPEMVEKVGAARELDQQWADYYGTHYEELLAALKKKWGQDR
jgi:hypothetical protein